jgi:RNA ligase (TIGR02306 family)
MTERKLATIRKITAIQPIEGADAIEVAVVDGWKVVVKKGEFQVDSLAVYIEIDSWVSNDIAPFLSKGKEPREYEGIKGERLRTVKLRGQISQGLLLPISVLPKCIENVK